MIAADSCVIIDYLQGTRTAHTEYLHAALTNHAVVMPPVVIAELLSAPKPQNELIALFTDLALLPMDDGYWERAGRLRASIRRMGLKATLGDALIAQSCIDHDVPLLTIDGDFRHYATAGGLALAIPPRA